MPRKTLVLAVSLLCSLLLLTWSYATESSKGKEILIANGGTELENAVIEVVAQHFRDLDISVSLVHVKKFSSKKLDDYDAVLIIGAVNESRLPRKIERSIEKLNRLHKDYRPYVFISTISGENWRERTTKIDAVTAATDTAKAKDIAGNLIRRLERQLLERG